LTTAIQTRTEIVPAPATSLIPASAAARDYVRASKAPSTIRGYQSDWRHFSGWCNAHGTAALPAAPETVAAYIAECASWLKVGSIQRRLNAIAEAHKATAQESPTSSGTVRNTLKGIKRTIGTAEVQKEPTLTATIRAMVDHLDSGIIGVRDRALILLGFAGAFRRSELVGLDVADYLVDEVSTGHHVGMIVTLRKSKTDQEAKGRRIGIPYGVHPETCPVLAVQAWIEAAQLTGGPLFRRVTRHGRLRPGRMSGIAVARIVKKLVARAGLDATKFAGHSLRSGHATSAAEGGASERSIMDQTGHRSLEMVRRYIHEGSLFRENSADRLGL
jgi:integrase